MNPMSILHTGMALGRAAGRGSAQSMGSAFAKVASMATGAGGKLSALTGGAMSSFAGTGVAVGGGVMSMLLVVLLGAGGAGNLIAKRDGILSQLCAAATEVAKVVRDGSDTDTSATTEDNAKKVYSVLSYAGMNDENIAGIIGNWDAESGIDQTSVQGIFDEPHALGPRKKAKLAAGGFANNSTGLGLGQWTGGRAQLLLDYADKKGKDWNDIELQLAFMLDPTGDNPGDVEVIQDMVDGKNEGAADPGAAALDFHAKWERSADTSEMAQRRAVFAGKWFAKMSSWTVDSSLADSVLGLAEQVKKTADKSAQQAELTQCPLLEGGGGAGGGNSDAAKAAVSYAWAMSEDSHGNDGTDMYKYLHDEVFEGDAYYASCDRTVGTAVRWSGTDDNYPPGPVSAQMAYLTGEGAEKWEKVGVGVSEDELKPGDVQLTNDGGGHTFMFVGKEAVEQVWGDKATPDGVIVSGSLNDRSPGVNNNGELSDGRSFTTFRSKGPEKKSKFKDIKVPANIKPNVGDKTALTTPG